MNSSSTAGGVDAFVMAQYSSIRKEIEETKARIFRISAAALLVLPGAQFLANAYEVDVLILSLPLLVVVVALWYLSENHALMRCGRYLREHVEPRFPAVTGWETWLEGEQAKDARSVDKFAAYAFFGVFFVYYIISCWIGIDRTAEFGSEVILVVAFMMFALLGSVFMVFLMRNVKTATTTLDPNMRRPFIPASWSAWCKRARSRIVRRSDKSHGV